MREEPNMWLALGVLGGIALLIFISSQDKPQQQVQTYLTESPDNRPLYSNSETHTWIDLKGNKRVYTIERKVEGNNDGK